MTKKFTERDFDSFNDRGSGKLFCDMEFLRCHFIACGISITDNVNRRSRVINSSLINCEQHGCYLGPAILENVIIDGLRTNGLFQALGSVFKHVVLKGKIDRIMISPLISGVAMGRLTSDKQKPFDEATKFYYSAVDWALDIREAEFNEAELQGISANLILRDNETQFVITREKALLGRWKNIDLSGTYWQTSIEWFLERGTESEVLVAPKRNPKFLVLLDGLKRLRDEGVLE